MIEPKASPTVNEKPAPRSASPFIPVLSGLLVLVAIAVFAYVTQAAVGNSRNWVLHTYEVRTALQDLETSLAEIRGSALAYNRTGDASQLRLFRQDVDRISARASDLRKLTADNVRQQVRLGELESLSKKYVSKLENSAVSGAPLVEISPSETASIRDLDLQESQLDAVVRSMAEEEKTLLDERLGTWDHLFRRNALIFALAFTAALLLLAYNYRLLSREVVRTHEMERVQRENVRSSRALSARILELQDTERRKIARELHDSVGQYLVGLKINLEQLSNTGPNLNAVHAKLLTDTVELTDRSMTEVRTISHLLHPPLLDEVGLESAARWYADGFAKRCGLKVTTRLSDFPGRLPKEVELALFRVLQESLTNVHRHANAKSVEITLSCTDGQVSLVVNDDGCGVPSEVVSRFQSGLASGVGLAGMRERLAELNGNLEVARGSRGTTVRASVPTPVCNSSGKEDQVESNAV
jgi:signal transduction histidine kinase